MRIIRHSSKYTCTCTNTMLVAICSCILIHQSGFDNGTTSVYAFADRTIRRTKIAQLENKNIFDSDTCIRPVTTTVLFGSRDSIYTKRVGSMGGGQPDEMRSKRQERVGQLVSSELGKIIHTGIIKGRDVEYMEDELRQRISVVKTDVSPDLRQARVSVSIRAAPNVQQTQSQIGSIKNYSNLDSNKIIGSKEGDINSSRAQTDEDDDAEDEDDDTEEDDDCTEIEDDPTQREVEQFMSTSSAAVDKRRVYSWLVRNTKPIRHTLAQRMSHMKSCPTLTFVQVDVAAAVDVMYLIDKVVAGQKRETIQTFPENSIDEFGDDDDYDDDDEDDGIAWEEVDDDFFQKR